MKKIVALFFGITMLVVGMLVIYNQTPGSCPKWASQLLKGVKNCETLPLNITQHDVIGLYQWRVGSIQLNDSYVDNVFGITFYGPDGSPVSPKDMQQRVTYYFDKTVSSASFNVWPNEDYNSSSLPTKIILAKP